MPQGGIHPMSAAVLKERGANADGFHGRFAGDLELTEFDHIILIGGTAQGLVETPVGGPEVHYWDVPDPYDVEGTPEEILAVYRRCADDLTARIAQLAAKLLG